LQHTPDAPAINAGFLDLSHAVLSNGKIRQATFVNIDGTCCDKRAGLMVVVREIQFDITNQSQSISDPTPTQ